MSCFTVTGPVSRHLTALSDAVVQCEWYTDWIPATGLDYVQGVLKNKAVTNNFEARMVMQTAAVRADNPDAPILLESNYQASGERCSSVLDLTTDLEDRFLVRFGVAYHLSSAGNPGQSDTSLELAWNACGKQVGGDTLQLQVPGTGSQYVPLTGWIPAHHAAKLKAALVVTNAHANFRCQMAVRTANTSREATNAWSTNLEGGWHTGNGEVNTGEVPLSLSGSFWVQIGLEYSLSSGSDGEATVTASIAIRSS